ncbi:ABC transporter ATP-binding protein, partial [candidate division WOR-3 bacterium JGI_Cruoil_03_44_89]
KGNYSFYLKEKERRLEALRKKMKLQEAEIKRIQAFIDRFRYKASKAKQVQSRIKMLEKLGLIKVEKSPGKATIRFPECKRSAYEVLSVKNLSKAYRDLKVFMGLNFVIYRGDKIALVGVNGAGKSTLTRLLNKTEKPTSGEVKYGVNVRVAYFSQESSKNLNYAHTVWEEIDSTGTKCTELEKRSLLGAFLFSGADIHKRISVLSGGEKSRLALLNILLQDSNLLILDEPTNHLDIKTGEIFQNALLNYTGTVVIVSHDRYFLDNLVNRVLEMRDKTCYEYHGNYSYFIEKRAKNEAEKDKQMANDLERDNAGKKSAYGYKTKEEKRHEAERRNLLYRTGKELNKKLESTGEKINQLEKVKEKNESLLCDPGVLKDPKRIKTLKKEIKVAHKKLNNLYTEWDKLVIMLDGISK